MSQQMQEVIDAEVNKFLKSCKSGTSGGLRALQRFNEFVRLRYPVLNASQAQTIIFGKEKEKEKERYSSSMGKALLRMAVFQQSSRRAQGTVSTLAISTIGLLLSTELENESGTRAFTRLLSSIGEERIVLLSLDVHLLSYDEDLQETALQLVQLFVGSGINPVHFLGEESGRPMKLYREWSRTKPPVNNSPLGASPGSSRASLDSRRLGSLSDIRGAVDTSAKAPSSWGAVDLLSPLAPLAINSANSVTSQNSSFQTFKSGRGLGMTAVAHQNLRTPMGLNPNEIVKDPLGVIHGNVWDQAVLHPSIGDEANEGDDVDPQEIIPTQEPFNPALFIAKVHQNTSLDDLQKGISVLKHERELKDRQMRSLVLENIHEFVHCRDTIEQIRSMVERGNLSVDDENKKRSGLGLVHHVRACIEDLQETAQDKLMPNIAARKQLIQLRKSMAMLERFNKSLQQVNALDELIDQGEFTSATGLFCELAHELPCSDIGIDAGVETAETIQRAASDGGGGRGDGRTGDSLSPGIEFGRREEILKQAKKQRDSLSGALGSQLENASLRLVQVLRSQVTTSMGFIDVGSIGDVVKNVIGGQDDDGTDSSEDESEDDTSSAMDSSKRKRQQARQQKQVDAARLLSRMWNYCPADSSVFAALQRQGVHPMELLAHVDSDRLVHNMASVIARGSKKLRDNIERLGTLREVGQDGTTDLIRPAPTSISTSESDQQRRGRNGSFASGYSSNTCTSTAEEPISPGRNNNNGGSTPPTNSQLFIRTRATLDTSHTNRFSMTSSQLNGSIDDVALTSATLLPRVITRAEWALLCSAYVMISGAFAIARCSYERWFNRSADGSVWKSHENSSGVNFSRVRAKPLRSGEAQTARAVTSMATTVSALSKQAADVLAWLVFKSDGLCGTSVQRIDTYGLDYDKDTHNNTIQNIQINLKTTLSGVHLDTATGSLLRARLLELCNDDLDWLVDAHVPVTRNKKHNTNHNGSFRNLGKIARENGKFARENGIINSPSEHNGAIGGGGMLSPSTSTPLGREITYSTPLESLHLCVNEWMERSFTTLERAVGGVGQVNPDVALAMTQRTDQGELQEIDHSGNGKQNKRASHTSTTCCWFERELIFVISQGAIILGCLSDCSAAELTRLREYQKKQAEETNEYSNLFVNESEANGSLGLAVGSLGELGRLLDEAGPGVSEREWMRGEGVGGRGSVSSVSSAFGVGGSRAPWSETDGVIWLSLCLSSLCSALGHAVGTRQQQLGQEQSNALLKNEEDRNESSGSQKEKDGSEVQDKIESGVKVDARGDQSIMAFDVAVAEACWRMRSQVVPDAFAAWRTVCGVDAAASHEGTGGGWVDNDDSIWTQEQDSVCSQFNRLEQALVTKTIRQCSITFTNILSSAFSLKDDPTSNNITIRSYTVEILMYIETIIAPFRSCERLVCGLADKVGETLEIGLGQVCDGIFGPLSIHEATRLELECICLKDSLRLVASQEGVLRFKGAVALATELVDSGCGAGGGGKVERLESHRVVVQAEMQKWQLVVNSLISCAGHNRSQ